jgi:hypothetical protein
MIQYALALTLAISITACGPRYREGWRADEARYLTKEEQERAFKQARYRCLKEAKLSMSLPQKTGRGDGQIEPVGFGGPFFGQAAGKTFERQRQLELEKRKLMKPNYDEALFRACMEAAGFTHVREKIN